MTVSGVASGAQPLHFNHHQKQVKNSESSGALVSEMLASVSASGPAPGATAATQTGADAGSDQGFGFPGGRGLASLLGALQVQQAQGGSSQSSDAQAFADNLTNLLSSVASGDSSTAKTAAASLQQQLSDLFGGSSTSTSTSRAASGDAGGKPDFLSDLNNLISAVQSGDSTTAKSLASSITQHLEQGPPPPPPSDGVDDDQDQTTASSQSGLAKSVDALLSAVGSGDATAAKTAATSLESALKQLSGSDTNSSSDDSDPFLKDLQTLISNVQSGDTTAAQATAATISAHLAQATPAGAGGPPPGGPPPGGPPPGGPRPDGDGSSSSSASSTDSSSTSSASSAQTAMDAALRQILAYYQQNDSTPA